MRYACSMVAFVDGGLPFGSLVFHHQFSICLFRSLSVSSAGFSWRFRSRYSTSDLADAGRLCWKCLMRLAGMKRPLVLVTAFQKVLSACSTVLVSPALTRYSSHMACPVRFHEADVVSPRPINRGQFGVDGDEDGQMIFQIGAGLYAVGRPVQKRNDEDGQIGTIQSLPLERGALFNRFFW